MKLNYDCTRAILIAVEEKSLGDTYSIDQLVDIVGYNEGDVTYCCLMLNQAGMLDVLSVPVIGTGIGIKTVEELTFSGHEFLEKIRPDTVWKSTKKKAMSIGSFSIDVLSEIASQVLAQMITGHF